MGTTRNNRINQFCVLAASALLVLSFSPADAADKCRTGCHGSPSSLFKYQDGTTYKYSLDGNVEVSLSGAEKQHTTTSLKATVLMTPMKDCQHLLQLKDVVVVGPDSKKYPSQKDLQKAVRMLFNDGYVDDEICTEAGDSQNSLNIKRAVISMFQASTRSSREIDVFGDCPTSFTTSKEGSYVVVHKSRDLNSCSHRESLKQDFVTSTFNPYSEIKSSPLLNGDYTSTQRIKNGVLENVDISEHYLYRPFSNGQNGAKATVTTKLTLIGQQKDKVQSQATEPRSILFENPHLVNTPTSNVNNLIAALQKSLASSTGENVVKSTSARDYNELVNTMRVTPRDDILSVHGQVKAGAGFKDVNFARTLFLEALARAGTGDTIEVAIQLLKRKQIPAEQQKIIYLGLAFVKHASSSSLGAATALLDMPNVPREAYLGVGNLAYRFCREHNCENDQNLNKLTQKMMSKLTSCHTNNREEENQVIAILKGLGNFGRLNDAILDKLVTCASDKKVPTRVRIAALETFRADAGKLKLKKAAIELLNNRDLDSEIRIHAYLTLVNSPCGMVANTLKDLLATEPVNQVGSFIVSHLRNVRSSSNPDKELAKQHFGLLRSPKRFPFDVRRFSFNNELSYAIDSLGMASQIESNVIYSQNSFLPRSVSLNLTTELFGHAFNIFEVNLRQENLDNIVEHYLGPRGVLKTSSTGDIIEQSRVQIESIVKKIKERMEKTKRGRRDVSHAELEAFAKQVYLATHPSDTELDLDLSLKVFGSEISFLNFNEGLVKLTPEAVIDKVFDYIDNGIDKAKQFEFNTKPHAIFLDAEIAYPTSTGFPLKLSVVGSSAFSLSTSGNIDIRRILQDPKNAEYQLNIIPSAAIEITGSMTIDAFVVESGLQVTTNLHTATGSELKVKLLNNGKGIDVTLGLPVENQDIITISHDIVFATRELGYPVVETPLKFSTNRKDYYGCFDQLSSVFGQVVCVKFGIPLALPGTPLKGSPQAVGANFPLSGPATMSLKINRDDAKTYHLRVLYQDDKPDYRKFTVTFDTPKSKVNRKIDFAIEASRKPEVMFKATLKSDSKSAILEGHVINTPNERALLVKFVQNDQEHSAKVGVKIKGDQSKSEYTPLIEINTPTQKHSGAAKGGYSIEGSVIVEKQPNMHKYAFEKIRFNMPDQPAYGINGFIMKKDHIYSTDLILTYDKAELIIKGDLDALSVQNYKLNGEIRNTLNPNVNVKVHSEYKYENSKYDYVCTIIHGQDLKSTQNRFHLENHGVYKYESSKSFDISSSTKLSYPALTTDFKLDSHVTPKTFNYDVSLTYNKVKFESALDSKVNQKAFGDYSMIFNLGVMDNKIKLEAKRDLVSQEKSKYHYLFQVQERKYQVDAVVDHHIKSKDVKIVVDATVRIHGTSDPFKVNYGLVSNPSQVDTYTKIVSGSVQVVDITYKTDRVANADGHLKILLGSVLEAEGILNSKNGKGQANILLHLKKVGRKVKAVSTFTFAKPTYNVAFDFFFDFEKDPTKKIHFSTENKMQENSVNSKNVLDVFSYKTLLNFNGNMNGKVMDGKMNGAFDITFPTNHYLSGKLDREIHPKEGLLNGNANFQLEGRANKNARGVKVTIHGVMKDTSMKEHRYDLHYTIELENSEGKNVILEIGGKHQHKDGKKVSTFTLKTKGSLVSTPMELNAHGDYNDKIGTYDGNFKYGSRTGLSVNGKYDSGVSVENKYHNEMQLSIDLPSDKYRNIKLAGSGTLTKPKVATDVVEIMTSHSITLNNEKSAKLDVSVRGNKEQGSGKVSLTLTDGHPITVSASYKRQENDAIQFSTDIVQYGDESKNVKFSIGITKPNPDQVVLKLNLLTPVEKLRVIDLTISNKRLNNGKNYHTEIQLNANDKKYGVVSEISLSETNPSFDIQCTCPDGDKARIAAKLNKLGDHRYTGEFIILNIYGLSIESSGEANLESIDNFAIKMNINSAKLKLNNVHVEIMNKAVKGAKRINFSATSENKNLISGSTSYRAKEEGGKFIVEGSGNVKIKEESKSANFKFIRKTLTQEKDNEIGNEITFNMAVGNINIVEELHVSNKQFHALCSYCEEKQQCAHFEVRAKADNTDIENQSHEMEVSVDLRKFGLNKEFGLKSVGYRKRFDTEHTIDMYFHAEEKHAYQYKMYMHPNNAGLILTMPKRIVSIETVMDVQIQQAHKSSAKFELVFHLDKKNHPEQKTVFSMNGESSRTEQVFSTSGTIRFSHPSLGKDLAITGYGNADKKTRVANMNIDLDIFAKSNQKIVFTGKMVVTPLPDKGYRIDVEEHITSEGQNIHADSKGYYAVSTKELSAGQTVTFKDSKHSRESQWKLIANDQLFELLVKIPKVELLHITSKLQKEGKSVNTVTNYNIYGYKPVVAEIQINEMNTVTYTVYKKDVPQEKFNAVAGFALGQVAEIKTSVIKGGQKKELFHYTIHLDDAHFMKTDYNANADNVKSFVEYLRKENTELSKALKSLADTVKKEIDSELSHMQEEMKKVAPNLKPLIEFYKQQLMAIREELISDKTIKEISEFFKNVFGAAIKTVTDIISKIVDTFEKIYAVVYENVNRIVEVLNKDLIPQLQESASKISKVIVSIFEKVTDVVFLYVSKIIDMIKSHEAEFKEIAAAFSEITQDVGRVFVKTVRQIHIELKNFVTAIFKQIQSLPITEMFREKYQELTGNVQIPEYVYDVFNDVVKIVHSALPTQELQDALTLTASYVEKKLRQVKFNEEEAIEKIYEALLKGLRSLFVYVRNEVQYDKVQDIFSGQLPTGYTPFKFPRYVPAKFSAFNMIQSDDLPTPQELLITYRPRLRFFDNFPPFTMHAMIIDGQHIFTFDERHVTFPGKCNYVLTQDYFDGNFSVTADLSNGQMKSITVGDKQDSITVKKDGTATINGAKTEYPAETKNLFLWQRYHGINIASNAGLHVACSFDLTTCAVKVSGFYRSRLRGLLGNGNDEAYDDFILPSGKVTVSEAEFGNAYKLASNCPEVKTVDHSDHGSHHSSPMCASVFGSESDLRICYPIVNPSNFRQACEHAVAAKQQDSVCRIVKGYVYACRDADLKLLRVPPVCAQCELNGKHIEYGEEVSVKAPQSQADIVFVLEQNKAHENYIKDLINPLMQTLSSELKTRGITDVNYALLGYGYGKWPFTYTNGGSIRYQGQPVTAKFADQKPYQPIKSGCQKMDVFLNSVESTAKFIRHEFGMPSWRQAYQEAMYYPYRPNAVRSIIGIPAQCPHSQFPILQKLRAVIIEQLLKASGVHFNVILPLDNVKFATKDQKIAKSFIGFSSDSVFAFGDTKKTAGAQSTVRSALEYSENVCIDIAMKTNGAVFSTSAFTAAKKKQFPQSVAKVIAEQLTAEEQIRDCKCILRHGLIPGVRCTVQSRTEREQLARHTKGGVKG